MNGNAPLSVLLLLVVWMLALPSSPAEAGGGPLDTTTSVSSDTAAPSNEIPGVLHTEEGDGTSESRVCGQTTHAVCASTALLILVLDDPCYYGNAAPKGAATTECPATSNCEVVACFPNPARGCDGGGHCSKNEDPAPTEPQQVHAPIDPATLPQGIVAPADDAP